MNEAVGSDRPAVQQHVRWAGEDVGTQDVIVRFPIGWSEVVYQGRRWGVTLALDAQGGHLRLFAEQLGGTGVVSANWYITASGNEYFRPCEMPSAEVVDFVAGARPIGTAHERLDT